jgi:hypothetical protein
VIEFTGRAQHAHGGTYVTHIFYGDQNDVDLQLILLSFYNQLLLTLTDAFVDPRFGGAIRVNLRALTTFFPIAGHATDSVELWLNSPAYRITTRDQLNDVAQALCGAIVEQQVNPAIAGSGWTYESFDHFVLNISHAPLSRYLRGGGGDLRRRYAGRAYFKLWEWLNRKRCIMNIKNRDSKCFKYAMELALEIKQTGVQPRNYERSLRYQERNNFQYDDLTFPIVLKDLRKFEKLNYETHNLALFAYSAMKDPYSTSIIYVSTNTNPDAWKVYLLHVEQEDKANHWVFVFNHHRLLANTVRQSGHTRKFCSRCGWDFFSMEACEEHEKRCQENDIQRQVSIPRLPAPYQKWRYFAHFNRQIVKPFLTVADFEAFNYPIMYNENSNTQARTVHIPASFRFFTFCRDHPEFNRTVSYTYDLPGPFLDEHLVARKFIEAMDIESRRCRLLFEENFNYPLEYDEANLPFPWHDETTECGICHLNLYKGDMPHWKYTNGLRRGEFDTVGKCFARKRHMFIKPFPEWLATKLLAENREPVLYHDASCEINNVIGWAHRSCTKGRAGYEDSKYKHTVMFHNLQGYDEHFIIKALHPKDYPRTGMFTGIPQSSDRFMTFQYNGISYIDTNKLIPGSLDGHVQGLLKSSVGLGHFQYTINSDALKYSGAEKHSLAIQKGEFPYEWFDHPNKLAYPGLPARELWRNTLRGEDLTDQEWAKVNRVWEIFKCKTFKDYHDLYLSMDVYLLADVCEAFRESCLKADGLEPFHYITLPSYSFDTCFLSSTQRKQLYQRDDFDKKLFSIELFTEEQFDMYEFFREAIRGGVSMCPGRFAEANTPFIPETYDPNLPPCTIHYYDASALYGASMKGYLPIGGYEWITDTDQLQALTDAIPLLRPDDDSGYYYEVDGYFPRCLHSPLEINDCFDVNNHFRDIIELQKICPEENIRTCTCLHDYLSDYPPAPHQEYVTEDQISPLQHKINEQLGNKHDNKTKRLMCSLGERKNYRVYGLLLKLYCELGFRLTKVHRVLGFQQKPWLREYVESNAAARAIATNKLAKDNEKLKTNGCYGKMIQDNYKFQKCEVIPFFDEHNKETYPVGLSNFRYINEQFVIGDFYNGNVRLDSPVAVGAVILDHSKYIMYEFYYKALKPEFGKDMNLLFTDTDSLCIAFKDPNPTLRMYNQGLLHKWMDTSTWPKDQSYYGINFQSNNNKDVIGKFKDEMIEKGGVYIKEVIALRSKMYSIEYIKNGVTSDMMKAKGVNKTTQKHITHQQYRETLEHLDGFVVQKQPMWTIRSDGQNRIHLHRQLKSLLSPCDSKRYLIDNYYTLPYGHARIALLA